MLTFEQFLHIFPSAFAILLCVLSRYDSQWIDHKVESEMAVSSPPAAHNLIIYVQQVANGAASLNVHIINVLLFVAGSLCAVFDWPRCLSAYPIITCIVLFALVFYDVIIKAVTIPLSIFDRLPPPAVVPAGRLGRIVHRFRQWPPSARLRWEQIALNVAVLVLIGVGVLLGGGEDVGGRCLAGPNSPALHAVSHGKAG